MEIVKKNFNSINEFLNYINTRPNNKIFEEAFKKVYNKGMGSTKAGSKAQSFCKVYDYNEAVELIKNGWHEMAKQLNEKMKAQPIPNNKTYNKPVFDAVGYQASVPRYLQNIPTSMVNSRKVTKKQPVITINKSVSYAGYISSDTILEESLKALRIVQMIENSGTKVNLNIILGSKTKKEELIVKVKIKSASERLNISKLAFPLVHPAMLRMLFFKFIEVSDVSDSNFTDGYGKPMTGDELQIKNEYLIDAKLYETEEAYIKKHFNK